MALMVLRSVGLYVRQNKICHLQVGFLACAFTYVYTTYGVYLFYMYSFCPTLPL